MKPIHPFPARMAPELALERLSGLDSGSLVLDPMAGSGVVLRQALAAGHDAVGFDMDPLAVLMAQVWTTPVCGEIVEAWSTRLFNEVESIDPKEVSLDWVDAETENFIDYWFAEAQQADLRRIAFVLDRFSRGENENDAAALNLLRLALSRIIVTKEQCASLARDTSHSRPHRVSDTSEFEVIPGYERAVRFIRRCLLDEPPPSRARVNIGDARVLRTIENGSVDAILTSPPYLNAIDYLRGHRLALVWLGRSLSELRHIRSNSIGAERAPNHPGVSELFERIQAAMGNFDALPRRYGAMIERYAEDLYRMISETARVLKSGGTATFVVGNSCVRDTFVQNAAGVAEAARMVGLKLAHCWERTLPDNRRYLPISSGGALGKRMRTETICTFAR